MEPQVETTLCVTGGRLDFEAIGDALGLEPTSTCRAGELPAPVTTSTTAPSLLHRGGHRWPRLWLSHQSVAFVPNKRYHMQVGLRV